MIKLTQLLMERIDYLDTAKQLIKKYKLRSKVKFGAVSQGALFSDATLVVLTSKNNPIKEIRFRDVYPTNIGELQYDQQAGDVQYLTASVTFNYRGYDFANVGASSTTVTTS